MKTFQARLESFERRAVAPAWLLLLCGWLIVGSTRATWLRRNGAPPPAAEAGRTLDLRAASLAELRDLPGIGPRRAADFARMRWQQGGRDFPPELVRGIGARTARSVRQAVLWPPPLGAQPP